MNEDRDAAALAMRKAGATLDAIAAEFGFTRQRACQITRKLGWRPAAPGTSGRVYMLVQHYNAGASLDEIAERCGYANAQSVRVVLNYYKIPRRMKREPRGIQS